MICCPSDIFIKMVKPVCQFWGDDDEAERCALQISRSRNSWLGIAPCVSEEEIPLAKLSGGRNPIAVAMGDPELYAMNCSALVC